MVWVTPLVCLDELEDKIYVQTLFELDLELFLDFADNSNQIEKGIFNLHTLRRDLPVEVLVEYFLHERVASRVKLLQELLDQVLGEQVERAIILQVVFEQELLVFVLDEVFGVALPRAQIHLRQEVLGDELEDPPCTVLPRLLLHQIARRNGHVHDLPVQVACLDNLRLEVLEFDR